MSVRLGVRGRFYTAAFFAAGRKLAAVSDGLHIVDTETGKEMGRVTRAKLVAASPDAKTIAITQGGSDITIKRIGNEGMTDVNPGATIVLLDANTCQETWSRSPRHRRLVRRLLPRQQNPGRHQRLGSRPDPPLRSRHWQGIPHDRDPGDPYPGLDVHARRLPARLRHGRYVGADVGSHVKAVIQLARVATASAASAILLSFATPPVRSARFA